MAAIDPLRREAEVLAHEVWYPIQGHGLPLGATFVFEDFMGKLVAFAKAQRAAEVRAILHVCQHGLADKPEGDQYFNIDTEFEKWLDLRAKEWEP